MLSKPSAIGCRDGGAVQVFLVAVMADPTRFNEAMGAHLESDR
jgi:hypothetical protein